MNGRDDEMGMDDAKVSVFINTRNCSGAGEGKWLVGEDGENSRSRGEGLCVFEFITTGCSANNRNLR